MLLINFLKSLPGVLSTIAIETYSGIACHQGTRDIFRWAKADAESSGVTCFNRTLYSDMKKPHVNAKSSGNGGCKCFHKQKKGVP